MCTFNLVKLLSSKLVPESKFKLTFSRYSKQLHGGFSLKAYLENKVAEDKYTVIMVLKIHLHNI